MADIVDRKRCIECRQDLTLDAFNKRFSKKGPWHQSHCRVCSNKIKLKIRNERKAREVPDTVYRGDKWCRGHKKDEPKTEFGFNRLNIDFLDNFCKRYRSDQRKAKTIERRAEAARVDAQNPLEPIGPVENDVFEDPIIIDFDTDE